MSQLMRITLGLGLITLAACDSTNQTVDRGIDSKPLAELQAGIWIDPNGCDHWIIDDGIEGYMSQRLDRFGNPVCSGFGPTETAIDDFKRGSNVPDQLF